MLSDEDWNLLADPYDEPAEATLAEVIERWETLFGPHRCSCEQQPCYLPHAESEPCTRRVVDTDEEPPCPRCGRPRMVRESAYALRCWYCELRVDTTP